VLKGEASMKEFKIGERVCGYNGGHKYVGTITEIFENGLISLNVPFANYLHPKQCRRLKPKPKPKSVRVTKEMLAKAWNSEVAYMLAGKTNTTQVADWKFIFNDFAKALGL